MLPFIELPTLSLGPLTIQPFGILVATGVMLGTSVAVRHAKSMGLSEDNLRFLGLRCVIFGFIACHLLDVFFYTPGKVLDDPMLIFRVWEGIASYGGILGATIAFSYYATRHSLHYLRYGDAIVYGFVIGFTFGRIGCATAHDHLGKQTDFPLAVELPPHGRCPDLSPAERVETFQCQNWSLPDGSHTGVDGTPLITAHDLGLYEVVLCTLLFVILTLIIKLWKKRPPGVIIAVSAFYYAPIRFFLDFLRMPNSDPKYLGLTPAQHLCLWTIVGGIITVRAMKRPHNQSLMQEPGTEKVVGLPAAEPSEKGGASNLKSTQPSTSKGSKGKKKAKIVSKKGKK